jgi:hypothetical protein
MTANHNRSQLTLRRPNGNANAGAERHAPAPPASAPAAPQPMPQAAPGALIAYNNFIGITASFQLASGFYLIDWQSPAATADLFLEAADLKGAWSGARCLNVMRAVGSGSGLTLGASGSFRLNNTGLGAATVSINPGP